MNSIPLATASTESYGFGGFWVRFFAFVIDSALISSLSFLILFFFNVPMIHASDNDDWNRQRHLYEERTKHTEFRQGEQIHIAITETGSGPSLSKKEVYGHGTLFCLLYPLLASAFYVSSWQATPGKRCFSLKVINYSGERISVGTALLRAFLVFALPIGIFLIPFTRRKQALHDLIVHTLVVKEKAVIRANVTSH
jgi:uncharacterized RDD family membrane protein YckC